MTMSMQPYGIQSMLKEGYRHLSGLDEAVIKNIEACKELSTITRTSLGPNGMNKMVINHLDKLFVTNDAATIVNELEIQHPAAKILVLAAKAQQEEIGDGANLTISFAGELLQNAEELIRMGLHPSEIICGYNKAIIKVVEVLEQLVESGSETMDVRSKDEVVSRMRAAVASKQFGQEEIICSLVADACIQVCPKNPTNFNVDNVRVAKLLGGGLHNSCIVRGMVLKSDAVGSIKRMEKAKVAVFAGGVDTTATETKGTVLIHSAEQLENYAKTEEAKVEELIKDVAESGAKVIVSGGSVGEMALHFCERYKIMVLKISSKFELRRFCRAAGAVAHVSNFYSLFFHYHLRVFSYLMIMEQLKLSRPSPDDLGYVDSISVEEIGGVTVTIARNEQGGNSISTVVLRGSTDSILDDLERAVDDGVNTYKAMCRDSRIVPGAAATEIELAQRLKEYANAETGLDKYAISKYAESFEFVPKTLADNAGLNAMEIIASLYTGHGSGNTKLGIDLEEGACKDVSETKVWDLFATKLFALKYASDAACTVLRVDQIIMAKQAGGPRRDAAAAAGAGAEED
ncbi:T-complex protein 1 subunit theta isoform X1 [Brassica rapa]|uniref:T-complex protein 1 subunit theta isoform X1 n=1 Tax=Brassica campestris TaxID=3711 RepID=UPI00142DFB15|nr:T-complex protein 1 subunit theta isoform X1 [Brassica rapa]